MAKQMRMMKAVTDRTIAGNNKTLQKLFVTRQEFGACIANINHKIDSIYETVKQPATPACAAKAPLRRDGPERYKRVGGKKEGANQP